MVNGGIFSQAAIVNARALSAAKRAGTSSLHIHLARLGFVPAIVGVGHANAVAKRSRQEQSAPFTAHLSADGARVSAKTAGRPTFTAITARSGSVQNSVFMQRNAQLARPFRRAMVMFSSKSLLILQELKRVLQATHIGCLSIATSCSKNSGDHSKKTKTSTTSTESGTTIAPKTSNYGSVRSLLAFVPLTITVPAAGATNTPRNASGIFSL